MTRNRFPQKAQDNTTARPSGLQRRKPSPLALEARLMFDGAAVATAVADAAPAADAHEAVVDKTAAAAQTEASREGAQAVEGATREIAFIDTSVADWQTLAQGIKPGVEVVLLDPAKDGLTQIADYLQGQNGLDAIHIVSHGTAGALLLGGKSYTTEVMEQYQAQFAAIGQALTESGDVLLYGCSIAQGTAGEAFINAVALATSADVEASIDATGAAALGGDWTLEAKVGAIETGIYADLEALGQYTGVLDQDITVPFPENSTAAVAGGLGAQTNLSGPDKDLFVVNGNKLYFKNPPDFEDPTHNNIYHVSVGNPGNLRNYTITVTDVPDTSVNAAPVANNDSYTTAEDTLLTIDVAGVLANDTDADGNTLKAVLVSDPSHGSLTLNANGSFTYTPDANYNGTDSFTYKTSDGSLDSNTATVSITINPVNDAPEATADSYSVNEDGSLVVAATAGVLANDNDANDNPANALTATLVGNVAHGTLNFNPDGSFTYTPNPNFNGLDGFTYQVSDNGGGDSTGNTVAVTINVASVNDAPVLGGAGGTQTFTEGDGEIVIDSDLSLSDVDDVEMESARVAIIGYVAGEDELVFANTSNITGAWSSATGVLTLNGKATKAEYEAALESVRYKNLNIDNPTPGSFIVAWTVNDGSNDSAKVYSTVLVRAVNDAPALTGTPAALAGGTEDTAYTIAKSDLLKGYTDVDGGTLSVADLTATNGSLTDNGDGSWTFLPQADYNGPVTLSYNVLDGQGGSVLATQSFTLAAVNDAPVALDDVASVAESGVNPGNTVFAGTATATGNVLSNDSDVDAGTTLKVSVVNSVSIAATGPTSIPGTYGNLTVDANGNYTYNLDNSRSVTQALKQGHSVSEVFNYTVTDDAGATASSQLTVTVNGTNDAPDIGFLNATTFTVEDDIQILDRQSANPWPATLDVNGASGVIDKLTVTLTLTHTWPGDLDILLVGPEGQGVILMSDAGGSGDVQNVVLTFDDAAAQAVSSSALSTGTYRPANYNDYLGGDGFAGAPSGSYGTSLDVFKDHNPNGTWSLYVMDDAGGDVGVISHWGMTFTTLATEGEVAETVVEQGSLDDGTVVPGVLTASGTLTPIDVDANAQATWSIAGPATYGTMTIDPASGQWTYTLDNDKTATQALREGDVVTETFTATLTDEHNATATQVITISIAGSNDAPVITSGAADARGTVVESGNLDDGAVVPGTENATGILTSRDVDASATAVWTVSGTGTYGDIAIDPATGRWTYTLDNERAATQDLHDGNVRTETFTATVTDDKGARATQTITVRVRGTNDAPVAQPDVGSVYEDASITVPTLEGVIRGAGRDTDPDHATRNLQVAGVVAGDAAPADANVGTWVTGTYGMLMLNADGSYQYVANLADSVARGETVVDTFSYVVRDPAGAVSNVATLAITITGTNDAPYVVEADDSGQVTEDAAPLVLSDSGTITFDDLDLSDSHTVSAREILVSEILTPWGGTLSARMADPATGAGNGTVEWAYTLDNANVQFLGAGQQARETFRVTIRDGNGGSASQIVTVTIHGANDAPYITAAVVSGDVTEDAGGETLQQTGTITFDDADFTDSHTVTVVKDSGVLGGSLAAEVIDGALFGSGTVRWTYELPNANTQSLAAGETAAETFTVTIDDGQGGSVSRQVSVTTTGVNDAPEVDAISATFSEDQGGQMTPSYRDVDSTDTHVITIDTSATQGTVTYDNGVFTYDPNGQFEGLAVGQTATDSFTYTVNDGHGGIATNTATITVTGTNDAPVAQDAENDALEAGGVDNGTAGRDAEGRVVFSDIDAGDIVKVVSVSPGNPEALPERELFTPLAETPSEAVGTVGVEVRGTYGWVTLQEDGSYVYRVDNDDARVQALRAADDPLVDSFAYEVQDSQGASHTATLRIAIYGQNDNPDGQDDAVTIDEDSSAVVIDVLGNDTDVDQGALLRIVSIDTTGMLGSAALTSSASAVATDVSRAAFGIAANADLGDDRLPSVEIRGRHDSASDVDWFVFTVQDGEQLILDADYAYRPGQADMFDPMLWVYDAAGNLITANDDGGLGRPEGQGTVHGYDSFVNTGPLPAGTYRVALTGYYQDPMDPEGRSGYDGGTYVLNVSIVPTPESSGFGSVPARFDLTERDAVTYDPGSAFQYLAAGETATTSFTYDVADEFGATDTRTVTVTVEGRNDGPVANDDTAVAVEAGAGDAGSNPAGDVLANDTDIDTSDTRTVTAVSFGDQVGEVGQGLQGAYGVLTLNADGTYTYLVDNGNAAVQALRTSADTLVETFTYTITDTAGATSTATLSVTIEGRNDAPEATVGIADQALVAGDQYTFELPADLFKDVDAGDTQTYIATLANGDPLPSWLTFDPETRSFTGVANNSDVGVLNIVITVTDASGATAQVGFALNVAGRATIAPDSTGTADNGISGIYATTGFNGLNPGRTSGNLGDANAPDPSLISFGPAPAFDPNVLVESNPTAAGLLDQNGDEPILPLELAMVNLDGGSDFMLFAPSGVKFSVTLPSFLVEGPAKADFVAFQMNGEPLPPWLYFDPVTGKFVGKAPKDMVATLRIQLTGKDAQGNERSIRITLTVDPAIERPQLGEAQKVAAGEAPEKAEKDVPRGRPGVSEQIRLAAKRGTQAERLAKAAAAMKAPAV